MLLPHIHLGYQERRLFALRQVKNLIMSKVCSVTQRKRFLGVVVLFNDLLAVPWVFLV